MSSSVVERPSGSAGEVPAKRTITTKPRPSDVAFRTVLNIMSFSSLVILTLIGLFLAFRGYETFRSQGVHFLTSSDWSVVRDDASGKITYHFGMGAMILGTLMIGLTAIAVGVPLSVIAALFLTFYSPEKLKGIFTTIVDLMASFPSILYGLWGFFVLAPMGEYWAKLLFKYFGWFPVFNVPQPYFSRSPFIAGLVLAIMIIPIVTSVSREIFSQTPLDRIQAAYALGATRWSMIRTVVLPFGASGVVGGAMLGLGRALGETVAVYSVLNIVYKVNLHVLFGYGGNVASMIVQKWGEATFPEAKALLAAGFILFLLTLAVNLGANAVVSRSVKSGK